MLRSDDEEEGGGGGGGGVIQDDGEKESCAGAYTMSGSIEESEDNIISVFCLKLANSQLACLEVGFNEPCNSEA
ncbi:hypothetical protein T07_11733 [Trichinella nelsoni]|uniref:Uncharacterized protein n=1 Tax=Trichinella nelsoni TaxID=6336 RepID=A0A0V0RL13_9BILA|nr:hypothetical protein T07_11733 [Trichinella nelsoni]